MFYEGHDLPAWVRFRPKPKPKPQYGPPDRATHMLNEMLRVSALHWARDRRFLDGLTWPDKQIEAMTSPKVGVSLRVLLPPDYCQPKSS